MVTFIVIIFVFLLIFLRKPIFSLFGNPVSEISTPLWGISQFLSGEITENFLSIQSKKTLVKKLMELQESFKSMHSLEQERDTLAKENTELQKTLGLYREFQFDKTARVLARPPKISYDTLLIDIGEKDGVLMGDLVFSGENILLGEISDIRRSSSLVELYSTPLRETEVRLPTSGLALTFVGRGGGAFSVAIPRDIPAEEGESILSSREGNYLVGVISRITGNPQDPVKTIIAKSPINMNYLHYVFIKRTVVHEQEI